MSNAYASEAQLTAYLPAGTTVADAARLLARASELVDDVVRAPFAVDDDGIPTNDDIAEAMSKATCAVVEAWLEVDEANDIDGRAGTQISTGGFSGTRAPTVPPRAVRILSNAGLLSTAVRSAGDGFFGSGCSVYLGPATWPVS